ncbi:terpene synthase family protein [Kitasatospora sp. MAA4]|uniref:terpene synthase family protein n=1 Tax=Kitasatospora sp. MAA4 TaxID=3035093 RepID=UPI002475A42D|nr:terpene synthase family protein [Kitasatospora sp. MAA4]
MVQLDVHPAPDEFLGHGYVDLCLRAWPTAVGAPLHLGVQWALLVWLLDDEFDREPRDAPPEVIDRLVLALLDAVAGDAQPTVGDHPLVRALADLVRRTREVMPGFWWGRYRRQLAAWIRAAHEKLVDYVRPGRTPTLHEYQLLRPADGGMLLAAMWCELAEQCVTPDWNTPLVQELLRSFSACGYLANDLAAAPEDTFTAVAALVRTAGLSIRDAEGRAHELLRAQELSFWWARTAVQERDGAFAGALECFRVALAEWTAASSRYAPPVPAEAVTADAATHRLGRTVLGRELPRVPEHPTGPVRQGVGSTQPGRVRSSLLPGAKQAVSR